MPTLNMRRITAFTSLLLLFAAVSAHAAAKSPADSYLALKKKLSAATCDFARVRFSSADLIGSTIDFSGTVGGVMKCDTTTSFVLNCGSETLVICTEKALPACIANGNTVRVLAKVGPGSITGLSDLSLVDAAYEYDISARESELTARAAKKPAKPTVNRGSDPRYFLSARQGRGANLSSRGMAVYAPYRAAIHKFNPRLSEVQLDTITRSILAYSEHYGIDPRLVVALFLTESGFKPSATSGAGAMGLGQLMPGTARGLGVSNAYDPEQNIAASIKLVSGHLSKYGDLALALSAYNAGPGAVKKYKGVPPYRETRNYVQKVTKLYKALCGE